MESTLSLQPRTDNDALPESLCFPGLPPPVEPAAATDRRLLLAGPALEPSRLGRDPLLANAALRGVPMFSLPRPARKARLARGGPPAGFVDDDEEGTRAGPAKGDERRLNVLRDGVRWVRAGEEGTGGDGAEEGLREEEEGMGAVEGWSGVGGRLAIRLAISCDLLSSKN